MTSLCGFMDFREAIKMRTNSISHSDAKGQFIRNDIMAFQEKYMVIYSSMNIRSRVSGEREVDIGVLE